jgi:hypothetical protein
MLKWLRRQGWLGPAVRRLAVVIVALPFAASHVAMLVPRGRPVRPAMTFQRVRGQPAASRSPRMPSSGERRKANRAAIGEDMGFVFGMFFQVMPVSAIVVGIIAAATGLVTLVEALVALAVMVLLVVAILSESNPAARVITRVVFGALVGGMWRFVVAVAPVPVVGRAAEFVGMTMVLWIPAVILAVVRVISRS